MGLAPEKEGDPDFIFAYRCDRDPLPNAIARLCAYARPRLWAACRDADVHRDFGRELPDRVPHLYRAPQNSRVDRREVHFISSFFLIVLPAATILPVQERLWRSIFCRIILRDKSVRLRAIPHGPVGSFVRVCVFVSLCRVPRRVLSLSYMAIRFSRVHLSPLDRDVLAPRSCDGSFRFTRVYTCGARAHAFLERV